MKRKRAQKPKPALLKPKPLTRAQKAKLTRDRNELTKRMRDTDPFYVHPATIPAGKSYQWFSLYIRGVPNEDAIDRAKKDGWKSVPFARHDFGRRCNAKGKIVVHDSLLMENNEKVTEEARKKEYDAARQMVSDHPASAKRQGNPFPILGENFVVSSPYNRVPSDAPAVAVPVTINFLMNAHWQDAAAGLGLTNEEYARRRLLMTMPILAGEPTGDATSVYEAVTLKIGIRE